MFSFFITRFKTVLLTILGVFRRALCCFSRRRKYSNSEFEPLESINVVSSTNSSKNKNELQRDWNSWDDSPRTVEEHIERYRQKLVKPPTPQPTETDQDMNFFEDMTPKIKKQTKILIGASNQNNVDFSRLEANNADIPVIADLEDWEETEGNVGWEEIDDANTKQLIREKRKELRAQRQMKKDQNFNPGNFAERIGIRNS